MSLFSLKKNSKKPKIDNDTQDWNKDLKRNAASKKVVSQQGFDFEENIEYPIDESILSTSGTKMGPSFNVEEITQDQVKILKNCTHENSAADLIKILKRTNRTKFKQSILDPLIDCGFFELTVPQKPKSPKQKYRLTGKFVHKKVRD